MKIIRNKFYPCFLLLILFFLTGITRVQALTLKEAINVGLENNKEIRQIKEEIRRLENNLKLNNAKRDWQVNIDSSLNYNLNENNSTDELRTEVNQDSKNVNLNISKTFASGLEFTPIITIKEDNLNPDLSLDITRSLYPITPTQLEEQFYKTKKELLKVEKNLNQIRSKKIISWLETYLYLIRSKDKKEIYTKLYKQAQANLKNVEKEKKIGEAGKQEILTAELSVKEAKYNLKNTEHQLQQAKSNFKNQLGLELNDENIQINEANILVEELRKEIGRLLVKYQNTNNLMKLVEQNNYDIYVNRINRKILKKESNWLEKEGKGNVNLKSSYDTESEEFLIGLNLSYQLYDGGQKELNLKSKQDEIKNNEKNYVDLYQELKNQLENYKQVLELKSLAMNKEKLRLEKNRNQVTISEKQYNQGLIDYLELQKTKTTLGETEISYQSLKDQLFIDKLELINFIDREVWVGGILK